MHPDPNTLLNLPDEPRLAQKRFETGKQLARAILEQHDQVMLWQEYLDPEKTGALDLVELEPEQWDKVMDRRFKALQYLTDRAYGKASQAVALEGPDGGVPEFNVRIIHVGAVALLEAPQHQGEKQ